MGGGRHDGCLTPLRQHVAGLNVLVLEWTLVTVLVQAILIAVSLVVYSRTRNGDAWLVDEFDDEGLAVEEGLRAGQNTPAAAATAAFAPPDIAAAVDDDNIASTSGGTAAQQQQQQRQDD
ncbi:hypothetical protein GGH95_005186, partial [Coemansia sp. RSA 1836]